MQPVRVTSNAAFKANNTEYYPFTYQAAGLLEIIGETETANAIYTGTYKAPKLE